MKDFNLDTIKHYINMGIDAIDNNVIVNKIIQLLVMSAMIFYNLLSLTYIWKVIAANNYNTQSILIIIYLILLLLFSLYIIFKKWDYKYIVFYVILINMFL